VRETRISLRHGTATQMQVEIGVRALRMAHPSIGKPIECKTFIGYCDLCAVPSMKYFTFSFAACVVSDLSPLVMPYTVALDHPMKVHNDVAAFWMTGERQYYAFST
jgi:hypothetical protein